MLEAGNSSNPDAIETEYGLEMNYMSSAIVPTDAAAASKKKGKEEEEEIVTESTAAFSLEFNGVTYAPNLSHINALPMPGRIMAYRPEATMSDPVAIYNTINSIYNQLMPMMDVMEGMFESVESDNAVTQFMDAYNTLGNYLSIQAETVIAEYNAGKLNIDDDFTTSVAELLQSTYFSFAPADEAELKKEFTHMGDYIKPSNEKYSSFEYAPWFLAHGFRKMPSGENIAETFQLKINEPAKTKLKKYLNKLIHAYDLLSNYQTLVVCFERVKLNFSTLIQQNLNILDNINIIEGILQLPGFAAEDTDGHSSYFLDYHAFLHLVEVLVQQLNLREDVNSGSMQRKINALQRCIDQNKKRSSSKLHNFACYKILSEDLVKFFCDYLQNINKNLWCTTFLDGPLKPFQHLLFVLLEPRLNAFAPANGLMSAPNEATEGGRTGLLKEFLRFCQIKKVKPKDFVIDYTDVIAQGELEEKELYRLLHGTAMLQIGNEIARASVDGTVASTRLVRFNFSGEGPFSTGDTATSSEATVVSDKSGSEKKCLVM